MHVCVCVCMCVTYNCAKFLLPNSCGILIIAIRLNTKHSLRIAATFAFALQKYLNIPAAPLTTHFQHHVRHWLKNAQNSVVCITKMYQYPNPFLVISFRYAFSTAYCEVNCTLVRSNEYIKTTERSPMTFSNDDSRGFCFLPTDIPVQLLPGLRSVSPKRKVVTRLPLPIFVSNNLNISQSSAQYSEKLLIA